jgi:hypothetical protein
MVLRLGLTRVTRECTLFSGSVVDREVALECNCDTFVESSVVHLPLIGLAGLLVAYREETLYLFLIRHLPR